MNDWLLLLIVAVPLLVGTLLAIGELVFRRSDLPTARRVVWVVALVVVPMVSLLAYAVVRPSRRTVDERPPAPDDVLEARVAAVERHVAGLLDDATYDAIIGGPCRSSGSAP